MESILKSVGSLLLSYSTHYGMNKFYNLMCIPDGFLGYIHGFLTVGSPICYTTQQLITNTQVSYTSMILMGLSRIILDIFVPTGAKQN